MKLEFFGCLLVCLLAVSCQGNPKEEKENIVSKVADASPVQYLTDESFILAVSNYAEDKDTYNGKVPCLVDFYADWCGPCKQLSPIIDALAEKYQNRILFYKVNVDQCASIAQAYGIEAIPTLFFCANGKIEKFVGALPADELEKKLEGLLK